MKKFFDKKTVFSFLIGGFLFGSIGVGATLVYNSNEINYTPSDSTWKVNNVKSALDELYATQESYQVPILGYSVYYESNTYAWNIVDYDVSELSSITLRVPTIIRVRYSFSAGTGYTASGGNILSYAPPYDEIIDVSDKNVLSVAIASGPIGGGQSSGIMHYSLINAS